MNNDDLTGEFERLKAAIDAPPTTPVDAIRRRAHLRRRRTAVARTFVIAAMIVAASAGVTALVSQSEPEVVVGIDISPSAFGEALRSGDLDAVDELLTSGADPDLSDRRTPPVMIAVARNDQLLLQRLIDAGANVEATDASGVRTLHRAAGADNVELLEVLLTAGADVSATDPLGRAALSFALEANSLPAVERLLDSAADPNQLDINDRSALYWAVDAGVDLEIIDRLIEAGGDPDAGSPSARDAAAGKPSYLERLG